MADLFISYAARDQAVAATLAELLSEQGWTVWWGRDLVPGDTYQESIERELATARCVIVLWSEVSRDSHWVRDEAAAGSERGVLLSVLIDRVLPPLGFRQQQYADLVDWDGSPDSDPFIQLKEGISQLLAIERPQSSSGHAAAQSLPLEISTERELSTHTRSVVPLWLRAKSRDRRMEFRGRLLTGTALLFIAIVAAGAGWLFWRPQAPTQESSEENRPSVVRFTLDTPFEVGGASITAAVSPDGQWIAVSGAGGLNDAVFVRRLDGDTFTKIEASDGARGLFWSPDSKSVAFAVKNELRRTDIGATGSRLVARLPDGRGNPLSFAWNTHGTMLIGFAGAPLYVLESEGALMQPLTSLDQVSKESEQGGPVFLPDGRRFFYISVRGKQIVTRLRAIDSPDIQDLSGFNDRILWASATHVVFRRGATLLAQAVTYDRLALHGSPVQLVGDVSVPAVPHAANASVSRSTLVYNSTLGAPRQFTWFARDGRALGAVGPEGRYGTFDLSDDGTRLVVSRREAGTLNLWVIDVAKGTMNPVTLGAHDDVDPRFSPDGRFVVFGSRRDPTRSPFRTSIAGDEAERIFAFPGKAFSLDDWSPDGKWLLYHDVGTSQVQALHLDRPNEQPVVAARALTGSIDQAVMSPDGRFVAYNSAESGRSEVYVAPFPPTGDKWQVSVGGGAQPRWRADGGELFYLSLDGALMAVGVKKAPRFAVADPSRLFRAPVSAITLGVEQYAAAPDGRRFLFVPFTNTVGRARISVLANWMSLLEAR